MVMRARVALDASPFFYFAHSIFLPAVSDLGDASIHDSPRVENCQFCRRHGWAAFWLYDVGVGNCLRKRKRPDDIASNCLETWQEPFLVRYSFPLLLPLPAPLCEPVPLFLRPFTAPSAPGDSLKRRLRAASQTLDARPP